MKKPLLSAFICLSLSLSISNANAQALLTPQLVLYTDVTIMATSYAAFEADTEFVNTPCHFWTEQFTDSTGAVTDTSDHFYYDKNDPDAKYNHTLTFAFGWLQPQTQYFYRQHMVDTNGYHYYSSFSSMKTVGTVSAIAEPVEKTCSVISSGKQLQVKSTADYMGASLQVYNMLGEQVAQNKIENEQQTLDLNSQQTGIYIVTIGTGAKQITKRILIK